MVVTSHDMAELKQLAGRIVLLHHGEMAFDAERVRLADVLEQASGATELLDVETHRPAIDDVVADLYEHWLRSSTTHV